MLDLRRRHFSGESDIIQSISHFILYINNLKVHKFVKKMKMRFWADKTKTANLSSNIRHIRIDPQSPVVPECLHLQYQVLSRRWRKKVKGNAQKKKKIFGMLKVHSWK